MGIEFAPGKYNRASGTLSAFDRWADALVVAGYPRPRVIDGDRELAEQRVIWDQRMVTADRVGGRRVYGTRKWQGVTWYQIHPDTAAPPDASNHVKRRSNDLAAPYNADTAAHRYAKKIAPNYDITCEGENFREKWHWTFWGALGVLLAIGSTAGKETESKTEIVQEDDMRAIKKAGVPNSGIIIQAGVPPYSMSEQVFQAMCGAYGLTARELPDWQYDTAVREQWTAANVGAALATVKVDGKVTVDQAAVQKIVDGIREGLPKTFTVTAD